MLLPEEKSVTLMKEVEHEFSRHGQLDFEDFSRTPSTSKACLSLDMHRQYVGFDKDVECLQTSIPSLVEVYAF